jgi:5-(carboxyamino)imidazole ribonucleotide synthase
MIGVLGAGQLGRMLALAGYPLGLHFRFLDSSHEAPVKDLAEFVRADFHDADTLARFAAGLEVVTYEFENVPEETAQALSRRVSVYPPPAALHASQDRVIEKTHFRQLDIPTAPFVPIRTRADLDCALSEVGYPAILKTRRLGYDGKGQCLIHERAAAEQAWQTLIPPTPTLPHKRGGKEERTLPHKGEGRKNAPAPKKGDAEGIKAPSPLVGEGGGNELSDAGLVLEGFVRFDRELSQLAVRGRDGSLAFYPLVENHHAEGILRLSLAPAPNLTPALEALARDYARRVLEALGYVGVLAIELFQQGEQLIANEMAPRVHNSGHWTIEGAQTSQFENHLRAILGLPLGLTETRGPCAMLNIIGQAPDTRAVLAHPGAHLHLYGKKPRPGRKIGHITLRADTMDAVKEGIEKLRRLLP